MSGGSYDYLCYKVQDAAEKLSEDKIPYRKAFGLHLRLIAEALHDIEWTDSCDYGPGDDEKAIMACISKKKVLKASLNDAQAMIDTLQKLINEITKTSGD